ncbi:hypothetical protein X777_05308 [Ooceraea biroi]|uniref:Uncharacterized protein n=1 Tax=Ooceraea biroi TaxID=2015173 RepID=A0A026WGI2_OOCBI|nr:hypothetical protein X777_05308 [Ooceraea biroi]
MNIYNFNQHEIFTADTKSMFKIENVLKTRTTLDGITQSFKDNWSKSEIQRDSLLVKDASETKPRCSRK